LLHDQGFDLAVIIVEIAGLSVEFRNVELIEAGPIWPLCGRNTNFGARDTDLDATNANRSFGRQRSTDPFLRQRFFSFA
jgi:hypothetical protein